MESKIEFSHSVYGKRATIRGCWEDHFSEVLLGEKILEIELNDGKQWRGSDLNFLHQFPNLKSLILIDFNIKDIRPILCLHSLENLVLSTYSRAAVDFKQFPCLRSLTFEWIDNSCSLFDCNMLTELNINRYKQTSSGELAKLFNLESLSIMNSTLEDIKGLSAMNNLKSLRLANLKNLRSLDGLECLNKLETLEVERCKSIGRIPQVFRLKSLKYLYLLDLGNIETLSGIDNLVNLERLSFHESTNIIDGDLSIVFSLKKLQSISFQNRKHYSNKREDFQSKIKP